MSIEHTSKDSTGVPVLHRNRNRTMNGRSTNRRPMQNTQRANAVTIRHPSMHGTTTNDLSTTPSFTMMVTGIVVMPSLHAAATSHRARLLDFLQAALDIVDGACFDDENLNY